MVVQIEKSKISDDEMLVTVRASTKFVPIIRAEKQLNSLNNSAKGRAQNTSLPGFHSNCRSRTNAALSRSTDALLPQPPVLITLATKSLSDNDGLEAELISEQNESIRLSMAATSVTVWRDVVWRSSAVPLLLS